MIPDISASNEVFEELIDQFLSHRKRMAEIMDSINSKLDFMNDEEVISTYSSDVKYFNESLNNYSDALMLNLRLTSEAFNDLTKVIALSSSAVYTRTASQETEKGYADTKIRNGSLPTGFLWVEIKQINPTDLNEGFNQKKFKTIIDEQWFLKLENVVLPAINQDPRRGKEYFKALDSSLNLSYPEGFQKIYERFFGDEHISLSRIPDSNLYSITNGIHRIMIAQQRGWTLIPARIK